MCGGIKDVAVCPGLEDHKFCSTFPLWNLKYVSGFCEYAKAHPVKKQLIVFKTQSLDVVFRKLTWNN